MVDISRLRVAALPITRRILGALSSRAFGSAAALQVHYDDDDGDYCYRDRDGGKPELHRGGRIEAMAESAGSVSGWGVRWVFMGDPAAKKHVYAEKLSKLLDVPHISMTTLLRQELSPSPSLHRMTANEVNHGELIPEEVILGLLSSRLEEGYCKGETGFILDGIPRTRIQAEALEQMTDIDTVMNFKSMAESPTEHCPFSPGCELNSTSCDNIADKSGLPNEMILSSSEQRKLVEDYYREQRKVIDFEVVAGSPDKTWEGLLVALRLQHI